MAHVISFRTHKFDISKEPRNPINPIAGQSVLAWLREELSKAHCGVSEPATEDWGWYIDVRSDSASYLVGASAEAQQPTPDVEWTVQVHKFRSLTDKLLGRNKMIAGDPMTALIERIVRADGSVREVEVTKDA